MDVIKAIEGRRSINFFEPGRQIPDDLLLRLISLANLSPSSNNLQPWKVVVVRDLEHKKILRACSFNQAKVEEASAVLIIIADPNALEENIDRVYESWVQLGYMTAKDAADSKEGARKFQGAPDSLRRKIFAVKNTSLFAMNIMIAAKGLGFETHPMDGFNEECVKKEFNIPDHTIIPMFITVGRLRTGVELKPRAFRRDVKEFVKFERFA